MNSRIIFLYFILIIILTFISNYSIAQGFDNFEDQKEFSNSTFHYNKNSTFSWPVFGYYSISSFFGKRDAPSSGASTYHSGIDIPAPTGTNIYSISSRKSYIYWILWC